jgi:hypothetical protein
MCFVWSDSRLAAGDSGGKMTLFAVDNSGWDLVGSYQSHGKSIVSLVRLAMGSGDALFSFGQDRYCVQYDLTNSTILGGVALKVDTCEYIIRL